MGEEVAWSVWKPTWSTIGWIAWLAFFIVWETVTLYYGEKDALTNHLRPVFLNHPLTWFVALGLWLWIGVHFLAPALERWLIEVVKG